LLACLCLKKNGEKLKKLDSKRSTHEDEFYGSNITWNCFQYYLGELSQQSLIKLVWLQALLWGWSFFFSAKKKDRC